MTDFAEETGDASIPRRARPPLPFQVERQEGESYYAWEIRCAERYLHFLDPASVSSDLATNLMASLEEMRRLVYGYRTEAAELRRRLAEVDR